MQIKFSKNGFKIKSESDEDLKIIENLLAVKYFTALGMYGPSTRKLKGVSIEHLPASLSDITPMNLEELARILGEEADKYRDLRSSEDDNYKSGHSDGLKQGKYQGLLEAALIILKHRDRLKQDAAVRKSV